jgi:1-deoxy-D-xylulose-5-phosphate synthase
MQAADVDTPVRSFGIPQRFLEHGERADILKECGLTAHQLFLAVVERIAAPDPISPYEERTRPAAARANRKVNR